MRKHINTGQIKPEAGTESSCGSLGSDDVWEGLWNNYACAWAEVTLGLQISPNCSTKICLYILIHYSVVSIVIQNCVQPPSLLHPPHVSLLFTQVICTFSHTLPTRHFLYYCSVCLCQNQTSCFYYICYM